MTSYRGVSFSLEELRAMRPALGQLNSVRRASGAIVRLILELVLSQSSSTLTLAPKEVSFFALVIKEIPSK